MKKYGYAWLTLGFFLVSLGLHWYFGYQAHVQEAEQHGQQVEVAGYLNEMMRDTFENWQSEFLQLFSFVTLAALYVHKGSAESKDGEEVLQASLRRIEEHLGTLPPTAPTEQGEEWMLPHTPLESQDAAERDEARRSALTEPRRT